MTPRAITGLGIASALGIGGSADFTKAIASLSSTKNEPRLPIASFDATKYDAPLLMEVPDFDPTKFLGDKGLRTLDRLTKLLLVAARLALRDSGLKTFAANERESQWTALSGDRVGVCCSNAYGSLEAITELDRVAVLEDARYINPSKFPNTVSNTASGYVSIWEDLRALNVSVSNGNCGALDAIACADIFLDTGRADAILTGGGESMSEALFLAFDKLNVLDRANAKLGEGAAFLVLESMDAATARNANVLATVVGYGTSFIAPKDDVTLYFTSSEALERAIAQALSDANLTPSDVDLVVAGTAGFERFDREERLAIANAIGSPVAIATPKAELGETLGAGGVLAMAASIAWLHGATLITTPMPKKLDVVLVTSVGYYGNASAVVMRRV